MGRLDDLMHSKPEDFRTLTVKVTKELAEELKETAKELGVTRTKLVNELFTAGYDELKEKMADGN
jgi:hypothetical protein